DRRNGDRNRGGLAPGPRPTPLARGVGTVTRQLDSITRTPPEPVATVPAGLRVRDLSVTFRTRHGQVRALSDVSFNVEAGEFCVVMGESGSGKSVLGHALLGLLPANVDVAGSARVDGDELIGVPPGGL